MRPMAAVAPGGELHVVDFGQQAGLPAWFRGGLSAWLATLLGDAARAIWRAS